MSKIVSLSNLALYNELMKAKVAEEIGEEKTDREAKDEELQEAIDGAQSTLDGSLQSVFFNEESEWITSVNNAGEEVGIIGVATEEKAGLMSAEDKAYLANLQFVDSLDSVLENNSWADISKASTLGLASSIWSVGDIKSVYLNGTIGTLSINQTLYVYILGFDHNPTYEGTNTIHFGTFKTSDGVDVGLIDGVYGSYYTDGSLCFNMNHSGNYNYGGWSACDLRYDVLGSTDYAPQNYGSAHSSGDVGYNASETCATIPVADTLMSCLPEDLRAVMKPMTKYSDNVAGATNVADNISATTDYLPLLSEYEVQGSRSLANSYEQNYQAQYDYYKNGNSKIKYRHSDTASTCWWWLRSAYYSNSYLFCIVNTGGYASNNFAYYSDALAPAFSI